MARFPDEIRDFAIQFMDLQKKRHEADHDPFSKFTRSGVRTATDAADVVVRKLQASNIKDKRAFAAWTVMKKRSE